MWLKALDWAWTKTRTPPPPSKLFWT
jgi:hypothetical protein